MLINIKKPKGKYERRYKDFEEHHHKFYHTRDWRDKRLEILERDNNECQRCREEGRVSKAKCVHHIKHVDKYWGLKLDNDNLVSLCNSCHNLEHPEKLNVNPKEFRNEERWE